ncbi:MAG TPA: potassium-transporting ATPase subunit C, partial [Myxococcota bacterium]|nr:potassium-transporting ATPase subunit C [Myxococcota bacterium]
AKARGIEPARVETLIVSQIEPRTLGILGDPRVNVLAVNLALDERFGRVSE